MIDIVIVSFFLAIEKFDVDSCLSIRSRISEVNEMPLQVSILVRHILDQISVSVSIQISVGVSWEMQNTTFRRSNPTR